MVAEKTTMMNPESRDLYDREKQQHIIHMVLWIVQNLQEHQQSTSLIYRSCRLVDADTLNPYLLLEGDWRGCSGHLWRNDICLVWSGVTQNENQTPFDT
jgi:hypothetical protein